uniref:Uncharacterized protein n=1 Tax=Tanacetum cinerariifolium TaxID=118510 RepID=A0A699W9C0_TANCI|nr:hypothetical protein [Tanacetum cinerariifolium]
MVQVCAREEYARDGHRGGRADASEPGLRACQVHRRGQANPSAPPIAPACHILVPPDPIAEVQHVAAVWATAMLATPFGAAEADDGRQLAPINRIEPAMFARDRHDDSMSQLGVERKQKTPVIQIYHYR